LIFFLFTIHDSPLHPFTDSPTHLPLSHSRFTPSPIHRFTYSPTHLPLSHSRFTLPSLHHRSLLFFLSFLFTIHDSPLHPFTDSPTHLLTCPSPIHDSRFTPSPFHRFTYSPTHLLTCPYPIPASLSSHIAPPTRLQKSR
jgi:hypothetical protein